MDKEERQEMQLAAARHTVEKAFRPPQECRAHEAGRCFKGDQCFESHNVPYHLITCCSMLEPKQKHYNVRFRKCTSIRVGKECKYSHAPQEEPTKEPQEEEMQQANDIEAEIEATASELQAATDKLNEKKTEKKAEREKKKAEQAANAEVANAEVGQPTMENIDQVRAGEVIASEMEANAMIAHYASANPEEPKPK